MKIPGLRGLHAGRLLADAVKAFMFPFVTPGAVLSVLLWVLASIGFNYYAVNFADYGAMYGSIGSVAALVFYFFISSAVLLFGAEINAVIERHACSARHDPEPPRTDIEDSAWRDTVP